MDKLVPIRCVVSQWFKIETQVLKTHSDRIHFERKIKNWTYRYLSLGGRVVLIKAVLTGLSVYWFALARCPESILNILHKHIYNFLWGTSAGHSSSHLANWELLALPFEFGGWDIKNLEWFGISLRLKSLWHLLTGTGTWCRIITHKYLKNRPLDVWLHGRSFRIVGTSYFLEWVYQDD